MKTHFPYYSIFALLTVGSSFAQATVVFSEVNLATNSITLTNTGSSAVDLGGWRFCSHDIDNRFVYSSSTHFNGVSIGIGESYVVNTTSIPFAGLLGGNTLSVGLYNDLDGALSFGSADDLSAFIQFAPEGSTTTGFAESRTNTAIDAGLWDSAGSFVEIGAGETSIILNDFNSSIGASSFSSVPEPSSALLLGLTGLLTFTRRRKNS